MARPQPWLVIVILMVCAVSHLCIADEQLINLNGEQSDDLLSRHSEGMFEVLGATRRRRWGGGGGATRRRRVASPRPTRQPTLNPKLWAGTDTLQLIDRMEREPTFMRENKLEEGVTCRGGIPKGLLFPKN